MTEQNKKIVSVEIVDLDKQGYGPKGKHTRESWREECYRNLKGGKEQFEIWQKQCLSAIESNLPLVEFVTKLGALEIRNNQNKNQDDGYEGFIEPYTLDFSGREFRSSEFKNVNFYIYTKFDHATFLDQAHFESADFHKRASFNQVSFREATVFEGVTFRNDVSFLKTSFESWAWFRYAKFKKATFGGSIFHNSVNFEQTSFKGHTNFTGSRFLLEFPSFRGSEIQNVCLEFGSDEYFNNNDFTESAIKNISFLKRLAEEHGQTDQALNFNAMELRAKRKRDWQQLLPRSRKEADLHKLLPEQLSWRLCVYASNLFRGSLWFCVFTCFYEKFSDFGRSYTRPLFLLMALNLLTFLLCICIASQQGDESEQTLYASLNEAKPYGEKDKVRITAFRAASEYSIYKTGNFLDFSDTDKHTEIINQRLFGSVIEPSGMRFYGFFKGLFSAIFIFLIGLGIRNKYRVS